MVIINLKNTHIHPQSGQLGAVLKGGQLLSPTSTTPKLGEQYSNDQCE